MDIPSGLRFPMVNSNALSVNPVSRLCLEGISSTPPCVCQSDYVEVSCKCRFLGFFSVLLCSLSKECFLGSPEIGRCMLPML